MVWYVQSLCVGKREGRGRRKEDIDSRDVKEDAPREGERTSGTCCLWSTFSLLASRLHREGRFSFLFSSLLPLSLCPGPLPLFSPFGLSFSLSCLAPIPHIILHLSSHLDDTSWRTFPEFCLRDESVGSRSDFSLLGAVRLPFPLDCAAVSTPS